MKGFQFFHADCRTAPTDLLSEAHTQISDLPYSEHVHANAVSCTPVRGATQRPLGFDSLTAGLADFAAFTAGLVQRWSLLYSDMQSGQALSERAESFGATPIRLLPWVRWSMPQLSGTIPPSGCELVVLTWGVTKGAKGWQGPGETISLEHKCMRGAQKHKAQKPLDQALDLVSWFSRPGDIVVDLTAGHATTGVACLILGRHFLGWEADSAFHKHGEARLLACLRGSLPYHDDAKRFARWRAAQLATLEKIKARGRIGVHDELLLGYIPDELSRAEKLLGA